MQGHLERCKAEYKERIKAVSKAVEDLNAEVAQMAQARADAQQQQQAAQAQAEEAQSKAAERCSALEVRQWLCLGS